MKNKKEENSNLSYLFDNMKVIDADTKEEVIFKSLWEESQEEFVIVHLFRRFG